MSFPMVRNHPKTRRGWGALASCFFALGLHAADQGNWVVSTADTRLRVAVTERHELELQDLTNPKAGWNWVRARSVFPFMNKVDSGGTTTSLNWRFRGASMQQEDGKKLMLVFTNSSPALTLVSEWQARPGPGPVRHTMSVQNDSEGVLTIFAQESLGAVLQGPGPGTRAWYFNDDGSLPDKTGVYREALETGKAWTLTVSEEQDFIPFAYVDADGKHGAYAGWEWSIGRVSLATTKGQQRIELKFGIGNAFRTELAPGGTFMVPPAFIGTYVGDIDDGGNRLRRYLFQHSMPEVLRRDATFPRVQWNAFAPTGEKQGSWVPLERKYYPFIDDIAPLGFEDVVVDVGWWSSYGDPGHIITHPTNWPRGMLAAAQYAHQRRMRFGLYDNEPEDLTTLAGVTERILDVAYLFKEFNADFYRSDSTAGPVLKGSHGGADSRARFPEDTGYWATKGFYEVVDTLASTVPGFMWECCSSGGRIKDFGVARRAIRIQNQDRYYPLDARQSFYDSSHVLHPMQLAALDGSWAEAQATGSVYEFRSASMGAAYWHPDAPNGGNGGPVWSERQRKEIARAVKTYKTRVRPLIRAGQLYHIFPRPDDVVWDGIEYFDPESQKGVVYIFKPKSDLDEQAIRLKGLDAGAMYWLSFEDATNPEQFLYGSALQQTGVRVHLTGQHVSELMFIEKL